MVFAWDTPARSFANAPSTIALGAVSSINCTRGSMSSAYCTRVGMVLSPCSCHCSYIAFTTIRPRPALVTGLPSPVKFGRLQCRSHPYLPPTAQRAERSHPAGVPGCKRCKRRKTEGGKAAGGTTACFPSSTLSFTRGEGVSHPHGKGSSTHEKTPTRNGQGQPTLAAAPFPRKDVSAPCRAGLLARGISTLCTFPRPGASVVSADFVPLTVAGQRWLRTIFPGHSH